MRRPAETPDPLPRPRGARRPTRRAPPSPGPASRGVPPGGRAFRATARLLSLLLAALAAGGCAGVSERWVEARFRDISYASVYNVVLTTVDGEGFSIRNRKPDPGELVSEWVYGTSQRAVRGPSRRRVHVRIDALDDERAWSVRLRVEEEVVTKGGLLATNVRESDNWEPYQDNFDDAEFLITRIAALLSDYRDRSAGSGLLP